MEHSTKINSLQILSVLLICRFFTMLVAVPNNRYTLEGGDSLLIPFFSVAAMALLGIPLLLLMKRYPQQSFQQIVGELAPSWRKPVLIWQILFCLLTAIGSASQSEYFVANALYPNAKREYVIFLFLLVVWYMIAMGIEAISRVSLLVCGLIVLSFGLIFTGVFQQIDWLNISSPFYEPIEKMAMTALSYWGQNTEILLLVLLQPYSRKQRFKKDFFTFLAGGLLITETLSFFSAAVLGSYGKTRMFPIYTLAALSGHGFFSRLDYLHIINWTFACLLRCAIFSWAVDILLKDLFPKARPFFLQSAAVAIILGATLILSRFGDSFQWFYLIFASGIPVLISVVLLPLFLLWKGRKRRKASV